MNKIKDQRSTHIEQSRLLHGQEMALVQEGLEQHCHLSGRATAIENGELMNTEADS